MAVKFSQHVDIDAPPDTVWALLTDTSKWPLWFSQLERISGLATPSQGASFTWSHGDESGSGAITAFDQDKDILTLALRKGDDQRTHTFDIDRSGGFFGIGGNDSRVRYTLEYDPPGGMLGDFVAGGNPADSLHVKNTLQKFKELAESLKDAR